VLVMVSIWHILVGICFLGGVGGAALSAKLARLGFGGYAVAVIIGLAVGLSFAWVMWTAVRSIGMRSRSGSESKPLQSWYLAALYLAAVPWIFLAGFIGQSVSSAVLRVAFH